MIDSIKQAYFRCDASEEIGMGHVMRCLTLAKAMQDSGWQCAFITIGNTVDLIPDLATSGFSIYPENYKPDKADLLIVDHYGLDHHYQSEARLWTNIVMVIDDLANRRHDCDLLLDQTFGRLEEDYTEYVAKQCKILTGANYILLRKQFLERHHQAKIKRSNIQRVENILINFGSSNPYGLVQKILDCLNKFVDWSLNIQIITSERDFTLSDIKAKAKAGESLRHRVFVQTDVSNMAQAMMEADLAFGAGGTTSWERASLGLPTILIILSPDQTLVAENLHKAGAVLSIGEVQDMTQTKIDNAFEMMRHNADLLRKMSNQAFVICDGRGAENVVKQIEILFREEE